PRADRRLDVDPERRLVRRWKELRPDERLEPEVGRQDEEEARHEGGGDPADDDAAVAQRPDDDLLVHLLDPLEEATGEPEDAIAERSGGRVDRLLRLEDLQREEGGDGTGHQEGGGERTRDRDGGRGEEGLGLDVEE